MLVVRGQALLGLSRTQQAAETFQKVLSVNPHARAYAGLARVAFENGRVDDALKFIAKALEVDPQDADLHALAGNLYAAAKRMPEAFAEVGQALKINPDHVDALIGMTWLELQAKDYVGAKQYVDRALAAGANSTRIAAVKAYTELALRNYGVAQSVGESILENDSGNVTSLYVSGTAAFALNETEKAISRLNQYLSQAPNDLHARAILDHLKRLDETASDATQNDKVTDEARDTLLALLSTEALTAGVTQAGRRVLESMATTQAGDSPRLRAQLSISKAQTGDLSRAEEELAQAIQMDKEKRFTGDIDQAETVLILSYLRKRDFDRAIELTNAYVARRPDQAAPYTLLAVIHAEQGDAARAQEAMQKALEQNPSSPELMGNYAALQARLGDLKGAIETLKSSIAQNEGHYPTMMQLAALSLTAEDTDQAIYWAEKASVAKTDAVEPRIILARSYNIQGKYEKTLEVTKDLAGSNAGNVGLLDAIGDAQSHLGQTAEAVKTYAALVNAAPYFGAGYFYLARSYMANGQDDLVQPTLQKALAIDPENYPARVAYARFMLARGDRKQAAPLVDSLTKQFGANPEIQELGGQLALAKGDYDRAIVQLTEAGSGFAKGGVYRRSITEGLVNAYWRQGNTERALAEMEGWLIRNPNDVAMRLQMASVQTKSGEVDAAVEQYERVIKAQPSNWVARNDLAMLLFGIGNHRAALEHAEIAYKQASDNPAVMDTLGIILLADKRPEQALPLLEKANAAAPHHPEIALHLCEAYKQSGKNSDAIPAMERVMSNFGQSEGRDALEQCYRSLVD